MSLKKLASALIIALSALAGLPASAHVPPPSNPGTVGEPVTGSVEQVSAFASDIEVNADGSVLVTEHVQYHFPEPRHGIYRDVPTMYRLDDGGEATVGIEVDRVIGDDGQAERFEVQRNRAGIRIRIGDPDAYVSGSRAYDIRYRVLGALRYGLAYPADLGGGLHDELYWNVTGFDWQVPIRRVSAEVRLPDGVPAAEVRVRCYTGEYGSTASDCVSASSGGVASFASNEPMTVVVGWPVGHVAVLAAPQPTALEKAMRFAPLGVPVLLLALMHLAWLRYGRDPKGRGTIVAEYAAPAGMTPAEVGLLVDESVGTHDVSASIIDLAVRGYLTVTEVEVPGVLGLGKKKDHELTLNRAEFAKDAALKPFEKRLLEGLFGGYGTSVTLSRIKDDKTFGLHELPDVTKKVYEQAIADGYFPHNPQNAKAGWIGGGFVVGALSLVAASVAAGRYGLVEPATVVVGGALSAVVVIAYGLVMSVKTPKGVAAYEHVVGFREYLDKAEKYRIHWQETENVFEKFLPYAMAFGVAKKWAKAFEGVRLRQPAWYRGSAWNNGAFNAAAFYGAVDSMNGAVMTAMRSVPQQSSGGSGFGGGSGGGFGGGGGGSW